MKILFTADWHIKLGQKNVPVEWQKNRYRDLVYQLNNIDCDLMIVGGDIFDRVPTVEELELYFELILKIKHDTIIFDGNHEAQKKGSTFLSRLLLVTRSINPKVDIVDDFYGLDNIDIIPYCKLKDFEKTTREFFGSICFTHVRGEIPPHVKPEIDLSLFDKWDIVLAGDLHSHSNSQRNILYPGSPLTTSFHRNEVETGVILIDTETLKWTFENLELPQLIRKTVNSQNEIVPTNYHHTIYEIEGDIGSLKSIKADDLLDKKIIKREHSSSLSLDKDLPIHEELRVYLSQVLKIGNVDEVINAAHDYIKESDME